MSSDRINTKLRENLKQIETSCKLFDGGDHHEAIRIAGAVRVLVHDKNTQISILKHLNAKGIQFLSTCMDIKKKFRGKLPMLFNGMGEFALGTTSEYRPKLGGGMFRDFLHFDEWWNQPVFVLDKATAVTRGSVVLTAADKDGAAHVDATLPPDYERIRDGGDLMTLVCDAEEGAYEIPISGNHYVALRQIGFELLNSPELLALTK